MISEIQKSKVHQHAIKLLRKRLHESLYPHLSLEPQLYSQSPDVSAVINVKLINMVKKEKIRLTNNPEINKNIQKQCQWAAKIISDKYYPLLFNKAVKLLRKDVKDYHRQFAFQKYDFDHAGEYLEELKEIVESGSIEKSPLWVNGAGVDIAVNEILSKNFLVVTNNQLIAERLSWLFYQLRDRMTAYIDFSNKNYFYHWIASTANKVLEKDNFEEKEVYIEVLKTAKDFILENQEFLSEQYKSQSRMITATFKFVNTWGVNNMSNEKALNEMRDC